MRLSDIQAIRPAEGAGSAACVDAIATARAERERQVANQALAEAIRADTLAHDAKALSAAEKDASTARLVVEQLDAMLALLRADLAAAQGRERLAELREQHAALEPLAAELRRWQTEDYPKIARLIHVGLDAQLALATATRAFILRVEDEYGRPEVRAAGELGVALPVVAPPLPAAWFPNWQRTVS